MIAGKTVSIIKISHVKKKLNQEQGSMINRINLLTFIIISTYPVFFFCLNIKIEENNEQDLESAFSLISSQYDINNELILSQNMNLTKMIVITRNISIKYIVGG